MIDLTGEKLISLKKATGCIPVQDNGKSVHFSTVFRWSTNGLRGIRLEVLRVGGRLMTSKPAIARFFHRLTVAELGIEPPGDPRREREVAAAEDALDRVGI